jgi:Tol biopolymer transport system component
MTVRLIVAVLMLAVVGSVPAHAQYFGQNKVQYRDFDFKVLKTEHFDIYYYPEMESSVQLAAQMAERWYVRLSGVLQHELSSRQPLVLYAAHPHFQQTNVLAGEIGEGTGGVTESAKRRVIMPFAGGLAETDHVLGHEIVHAFQYDIAATMTDGGTAYALGALPLWFVEGMAEYLSVGPVDANTAMWVRDATAREKMPSVDRLDDPDFFPYRYGHAFWAYVAGRWGDWSVGEMLRVGVQTGDLRGTIETVLSLDHETLTTDWHAATNRAYASIIAETEPPTSFGRALINRDTGGGDLNVAPALSPDGSRVVFLSERSLFAIEMYVADVATGKVTRKIVETAGDAHFDSLQFIESAGDWAPDGRRFVFSALSRGTPVLTIVDVDTGNREAEYRIADVDQVFNPAWSSDGRRIAFSAMKGGVLDLWLFDLETREATRLTDDPFADYDPEWAPNGREIAWVTDRFTANPAALDFGGYRIGVLDVASRMARPLVGFETGRNTNPEFSADGQWVYFIATPDGIPNVYRASLTANRVDRITNVTSGVSGITPLTPALSAAAQSDLLVFTVFEDNRYSIYAIGGASKTSTPEPATARNGALLPPSDRGKSAVAAFLQAPAQGLPRPQEFEQQDYSAGLSLDAVSQPTVGIGADRYGAFAAGGISFLWSDMLGNHQLGATISATNRVEEIGGALSYINRSNRWNWGVVVDQTPYVSGGFGEFLTVIDGQPVIVQRELRQTQTNRGFSGMLQYPFSRAQRIEFGGGYRHISFTQRTTDFIYSAVTGQFLDEVSERVPIADGLSLAQGTSALVYDTSIFGATSPILGQRYRFEYTHVAGDIDYGGVLLDYRRYFMPLRPFTLAFRGLHYGRYGAGSEDFRLSPLYLGYPGLVRGYEFDSFEPGECVGTLESSCPAFDDLVGSRMAIGSAELRFPLIGAFSRRTFYGPLPLEVALFGDAGVAWDRNSEPRFTGGTRDWARSAGVGLRFNLLGFVIGEVDYVKPLDRPERGWLWQFNFTPGW